MGRVTVLGGTGLLGRTLVDRLIVRGAQVVVADRRQCTDRGVRYHCLDVREPGALADLLARYPSDLIINAINIATVFSELGREGYDGMVRYHAELFDALKHHTAPTTYLQIGTTGSGGLGFDIPFTHGAAAEDLPIIHKAAFAGMSSQLLVLISRSFSADKVRVAEVKPGLAIFGERILCLDHGRLRVVTIDGGESGAYTADELALLTRYMGFTSVDRIADKTMRLLTGDRPGAGQVAYDATAALNGAIIGEDAHDRELRDDTLARMNLMLDDHASLPATGNLGPPSITRDLVLAAAALAGQDSRGFIVQDTLDYLATTHSSIAEFLGAQDLEACMVPIRDLVRTMGQVRPWQVLDRALHERRMKRTPDA